MSIDLPGFADPVRDAQSVFRAVLGAMSCPGRLFRVGTTLTPPAPLGAATAAVLLTLVDGETSVGLATGLAAATDWIAFHCGATVVDTPAPFVVATEMPALAMLNAGSDDAPEDSATLILQVASLDAGRTYRLAGPGLKEPATLTVTGLPADFTAMWAANHALFPRGIDMMLCSGDMLTALPRTVTIREG